MLSLSKQPLSRKRDDAEGHGRCRAQCARWWQGMRQREAKQKERTIRLYAWEPFLLKRIDRAASKPQLELISECEERRRRFRRPRERGEEGERAVQWNAGNPRVLPNRSST